jgi:hypothetical protein
MIMYAEVVSTDNVFLIVTRLWAKRSWVLFQNIQIDSNAHPASYSMDSGAYFPRGKVARS